MPFRFCAFMFCALSFFIFNFSKAEEQELWDKSLEDLLNVKVVSGTRKEDLSLRLPMVVNVLSKQDLQRWGADNLADGLRVVAGLQIHKSPGDFPQYRTAIRGNSADFMNIRTLFLIDGVPVQNPNAGFDPSWIPLAMVKRVEILQGPASGIYGANAFGGLVNVITEEAEEGDKNIEAGLKAQSHRDVVTGHEVPGQGAELILKNKKNAWSYFTSLQYAGAENTSSTGAGFQAQDLFAKLNYRASENMTYSLRTLLSMDRNQLALTNADSPMKNDFLHLAATMKYKSSEDLTWELTGFLNNFNHFLKYNDALDKYENHGQTYGVHAQMGLALAVDHVLTNGLDFYEVSGFLHTNSYDYSVFPPNLVSAGWESDKHSAYGIYSQYEYTGWKQFMPLIGVRYDKDAAYGDAFSPRLGLSYLFSDQINIYTSVGRGFRAPILNETSIQGFGKVGNPELNPEYATTYEVGLKTVYESVQNTLALFKQDITKQITLVPIDPSNPNSLKTFENSGTATITGLAFDGGYKFSPSWRLFYNASALKTDDGTGKKIERVAEKKAVLGLSWLEGRWKSDAVVIYESEQFYYNSNNSIPSDSEGRVFVPEVAIVNVQTAYELHKDLSLTLFLNNLTDKQYKEGFSPFIGQDGLWLPGRTLGLRLDGKF